MSEAARSATADRVVAALCWTSAAAAASVFGWLLLDLLRRGAAEVSWTFLTAEPLDAGRAGGIGPVIVSTGLALAVCVFAALPLGVGAAAWLAEFTPPGGGWARTLQGSLDLLAAIPSILFGLFGMVFFCELLGMGFSILSGGLTLAVMILPLVVQTTYAGFRSAPDELRLAAAALGMRRITTLRALLLPAAGHGVTIGVILGVGRALSETAALIFTAGYVTRMPESLLSSGRTLSVHIYDLAVNVPGGEKKAYATALVLLGLLLAVNLTAQWLAQSWLRGRT